MPVKKTKKVAASVGEPVEKPRKALRQTGIVFILGLLLFAISIVYRIRQSNILSFAKAPSTLSAARHTSSIPESIQFLPTQFSLSVNPTEITEGKWQIAPKGASYLVTSARPGEAGSVIIYAHNTSDKFGILKDVRIGDTISVRSKDGQFRSYVIREKQIVKPSDTAVLSSKNSETLILYTCTGFADTKRLVVKALPL